MPPTLFPLIGALALPLCALAATDSAAPVAPPPTTRQQTIHPLALRPGTPPINPRDVALYSEHGYGSWHLGPGEDQGRKLELMPVGYTGAANTATLLSFFSMSDVHITDKESPAQVPYFGWSADFGSAALGLYSQAYSPVMLSTTQVLDSAVRTVNALHSQSPFDFGIVLGDVANSSQYNELRWFIDVLDGGPITPSSGDHRGADTIGYQKPFHAAGLDRSIPWYDVIGNHDQFWMGVIYPNAKLEAAFIGSNVLNIGRHLFKDHNSDATGVYVGVVDGGTRYGDVIKGGPQAGFAQPPSVAADANRRTLTTGESSITNYIGEFTRTTSTPLGHGFNSSTSACYTFQPKGDLPLKVIVLDDTCKSKGPSGSPAYFGSGWIDAGRYAWLSSELQKGQDAGQLMIIATHIPINPQKDLFTTARAPQFHPQSLKTDAEMISTLHRYPNLILLIAGHRHLNTVTPQPSPVPAHPEFGFWEVETPSLRDFPRQFRTFDIRRNSDNSLSIVTTDVDPQVEAGSPAADSLGYAIGAFRTFGNGAVTDTTSHVYNAELVKLLTPAMQEKIAALGTPISQAGIPATAAAPSGAHTSASAASPGTGTAPPTALPHP
jgi:metallophosphoesterase (TIGR03768 family)